MTSLDDAAASIRVALKTVPELRVYDRTGPNIDPPGALVGPPDLTWESQGTFDPSSAQFPVYLIERVDDRAIERLHALVLAAARAIDETDDAVVLSARPTIYDAGTSGLPAYVMTVEVGL